MIFLFVTVLTITVLGVYGSPLALGYALIFGCIGMLLAWKYLRAHLLKISFYILIALIIMISVFIRNQYNLAVVESAAIQSQQNVWAYISIEKSIVVSHSYQKYSAKLLIVHNTRVNIPIILNQYSAKSIQTWPQRYWMIIKFTPKNSNVISATIIKIAPENRDENKLSLEKINQIKSKMIAWIWNTNGGSVETSVLLAIAMGDRSNLTDHIWLVFSRTGTSHLLAIAGLHLGVVVFIIWFLMKQCWQKSQKGMQAISTQVVSLSIAVIGGVLYALFTGWAIPCERAAIMMTILCLSQIGLFNLSMLDRILLAFSIMLFFNPWDIYSQSFWLSFIAVVSICYGMQMRTYIHSWFLKWIYLNLIITCSLFPWSLYFFGQYALWGWLANCIAVPWAAFFLLPLVFLSIVLEPFFPLLNIKLWHFCVVLFHPLWMVLDYLSRWHFSYVQMDPPFYLCMLYMVGYFWLFAPKAMPGRYWSFVLMLPLFFMIYYPISYAKSIMMPIQLHHQKGFLIRSRDHLWLMLNRAGAFHLNQWDYKAIAFVIGSYGSWSDLQLINVYSGTLFVDGSYTHFAS